MLDILLGIAFIGSLIAGIWDLFTTEVPDEIPALMIISGLSLLLMQAASTGNFLPLIVSLLTGTLLLVFGLLVYKKGGWGGADAWILAAIGYLVPFYNGKIFIIDYILNFFIVAVAFMIVYALVLGFKNRKIFSLYAMELRSKWKIVFGVPLAFAIALFAITLVYSPFMPFDAAGIAGSVGVIAVLMLFWAYAKVIEKYEFKKKIPVSRLREGDVLDNMLWRGLTKEEVAKIKKQEKYVTIKEGVRFVLVFPITLAVTVLFGNLLLVL